ncbi:MAG: hypothetical protein WKF59_13240 [Chitinophagaceae bacterium]
MIVEGKSPELYIKHTVAAKENYYSVGRLYNVSPKDLRLITGLLLKKALQLGK